MILRSNVVRRLFRFLHDEGVRFCVIGEGDTAVGETRLAVENSALPGTVAGVNHIFHAAPAPPGEQTLRLIASMKAAETFDLTAAPAERRKANHDV